jgi:membrane-associated protease RseP (regulator of RpoE activity)
MIFIVNCSAKQATEMRKITVVKESSFDIGLVITNASDDVLKSSGVEAGVKVLSALPNRPADKAGIKDDDLIVKFDGKDVKNVDDLHQWASAIDEGKKVDIVVKRGAEFLTLSPMFSKNEEQNHTFVTATGDADDIDIDVEEMIGEEGCKDVKVKVWVDESGEKNQEVKIFKHGAKDKNLFWFGNDKIEYHTHRKGGFLGVAAKNIKLQMKEYFKVENGILIEEIIKDSPAEAAGLKAGDIITKIGDRTIEDYADLVRSLNYYNPEEEINLTYSRAGVTSTQKIKLSDKKKALPHFKKKNCKDRCQAAPCEAKHKGLKKMSHKLKKIRKKMSAPSEKFDSQHIKIHII